MVLTSIDCDGPVNTRFPAAFPVHPYPQHYICTSYTVRYVFVYRYNGVTLKQKGILISYLTCNSCYILLNCLGFLLNYLSFIKVSVQRGHLMDICAKQ